MSQAIFNFNGTETTIQCTKDQKMKDICQKFSIKAQINFDNLFFIYGGNIISNFELTFEQQANSIDLKNNKIKVLVYECNNCDENKLNEMEKNKKLTNENIRDIIKEDLKKKGQELLIKHLDGRNYKEDKVDIWIKNILNEFEKYFKEKYSSYYLFFFCFVCSKKTFFYKDNRIICVSSKETNGNSIFKSNEIYSCLEFLFLKLLIQNQIFLLNQKLFLLEINYYMKYLMKENIMLKC